MNLDLADRLSKMSRVAQQARYRVAKARIAQVADVSRLVRVDAGVLDQHLPRNPRSLLAGGQISRRARFRRGRRSVLLGHHERGQQLAKRRTAIELDIEEPRARYFPAANTLHGMICEPAHELVGQLARIAAEAAGQLQRHRCGKVAHLRARRVVDLRHLDHHTGYLEDRALNGRPDSSPQVADQVLTAAPPRLSADARAVAPVALSKGSSPCMRNVRRWNSEKPRLMIASRCRRVP